LEIPNGGDDAVRAKTLPVKRSPNSRQVSAAFRPSASITLCRTVVYSCCARLAVAQERPADWTRRVLPKSPEVLTEADVVEAEAELRALQRHALEVVDPEEDR
jgi:hypothetical protein